MASSIKENPDTLYWTTLSLNQLSSYRGDGQIPPISFNIWQSEGIESGHKHLDGILIQGNQSHPAGIGPLEWDNSHLLISVEEPHTYFEKDPFSEGSLEN